MAKKKADSDQSKPSTVKKTIAVKKVAPLKKVAVKKATVKKVAAKKAPAKKAVKKTTEKKTKVEHAEVKKSTAKQIALKKVVSAKAVKAPAKKITKTEKNKPITDPLLLLVDAAVKGILEIKGRDISVLDLRKITNRVCDFYVICQADSTTQVKAIADSVEFTVKKITGERPYHTEGFQNAEWIIIDYVSVVVHVFQTEARHFYNLEALWADAEITKIAFD